MNIFGRVTRKTLLKNKTRTIVTIIGVILSAAMITAVTTSISSLLGYMNRVTVYSEGDWHGVFRGATPDGADILEADERVDEVFISRDLGYAEIKEPANKNKPYVFVLGCDETFMQRMPVRLVSGRLPQNASELIIPEHLVNAESGYSVGDTLTLELGERRTVNVQGELSDAWGVIDQSCGLSVGEDGTVYERLIIKESRTYTVVGVYERPGFEVYWAPGYTALTSTDLNDATSLMNIYFRARNINKTYDIINDTGISFACSLSDTNSDLLMIHGISLYENFLSVIYSFAAILILLIMFGSVSLIGNAFAISVSERTKQFGLLSSVGATKKQLRFSVFYEAMYVCIIGIPLGILSGIAGIGVTLKLLGGSIGSLYAGGNGLPFEFSLSVNVWAIAAAVVLCLLTVLISAWIPSRRATRITAIEAIRQSGDIKIKPRSLRSSKLVQKLFGLPGMLAEKHFRRNRKSYRATVVSLFMSIVLFVSASSFCEYLTYGVEGVENYTCDVKWSGYNGTVADALKMDESVRELDDSFSRYTFWITKYCRMNADSAVFSQLPAYGNAQQNGDQTEMSCSLVLIDDATYLEYLRDNKLDEQKFFYAETPLPLVFGTMNHWDYDLDKYITYEIFESAGFTCRLTPMSEEDSYEENVDGRTGKDAPAAVELTAGALCRSMPWCFGTQQSEVFVILPVRALNNEMIGNMLADVSVYGNYSFMTDSHVQLSDELNALTSDSGFSGYSSVDFVESRRVAQNLILIVKVFSYGFIALISLIAAANVFNTISTNIALRRREFAMLKSVGMTQRGFNKMMNFECLLYGFKAILFGLPVSFAATFFIFLSLMSGYETTFFLPWSAVLIAIFSVFAVVFATMLYSMSKIRKDNPIDALKNENL